VVAWGCGLVVYWLAGIGVGFPSRWPASWPADPAGSPGPGQVETLGPPQVDPAGEWVIGPEIRPGGDSCLDATPIDSLPAAFIGTTAGLTDDYDEICPYNTPGSPDAVYRYTPTENVTVYISLCNAGTNYNTKLYVYAGICDGTPVACSDDACPGYRSRITGLTLYAGVDYFIVVDGFGGACGTYELTIAGEMPPPACPENSAFGQPATGSGTMGKSEVSTGFLRFENYPLGAGSIDPVAKLRFWGLPLRYDGAWYPCDENPMPFLIKFYPDVGGLPGAATCSYSLDILGVSTYLLYNGYPLYQYEAELPSPCPQGRGWVSIQGSGDPNCWFMWMSSPTGDGKSLVDNGAGPGPVGYDLSLCLVPASVCVGDCNCDGQVDFRDVNPFVVYIVNYDSWQAAYPGCDPRNGDINGDGTYGGSGSFGDINPFVVLLTTNPIPIPCP